MKIKSITTKKSTADKFIALLKPEYRDEVKKETFSCTIIADNGAFYGSGASEYEAEMGAQHHLEASVMSEVRSAIEKYNANNSAGNLDIA